MSASGKLYLTYDNQHNTDGLGAQFQRILSVYCIAQHFEVSYIHSPIVDFDEQVFTHLDQAEKLSSLAEWNALVSPEILSHSAPETRINFPIGKLTITRLKLIKMISRIFRIPITLRLWNPRLITDKVPECFSNATHFLNPSITSQPQIPQLSDRCLKVVVHIRQGELRLSQFRDRYLPFSYFERILATSIPEIKSLNLKYVISIPLEPNMTRNFDANDPKVLKSLEVDSKNKSVVINDKCIATLVFEETDPIKTPYLHSATWRDSNSTYSDFLQMLTADILIISKSSFSFTAGLLNAEGLIIYTPFWHTTPSRWLDGNKLTDEEFSAAFKTWISRKGQI